MRIENHFRRSREGYSVFVQPAGDHRSAPAGDFSSWRIRWIAGYSSYCQLITLKQRWLEVGIFVKDSKR